MKAARPLAALAIASAALAVAACGGNASTPAPASAPQTVPAAAVATPDPVTLIRESGAVLQPPDPVGQGYDINGNPFRDGLFGGQNGEDVRAATANPGNPAALTAAIAFIEANADGRAVITGPGFVITVQHGWTADGSAVAPWQVTPAVIAARVHGTIIIPGA